jgi:hypothetical protein
MLCAKLILSEEFQFGPATRTSYKGKIELKVCHPLCVDIKRNVVIRTVNKHNSMWYDITIY